MSGIIDLVQKNKIYFYKLMFLLILISGCQTIKNKTDEIVEKENTKLSGVYWKKFKQFTNGI